jgi:hypothetical protein
MACPEINRNRIMKFNQEGRTDNIPLIKSHKGKVNSSETGIECKIVRIQKIKMIIGIIISVAGCGDLKKRIIGVKSIEFKPFTLKTRNRMD